MALAEETATTSASIQAIHLVPDELDDDSAQWAAFTLRHLGRAPNVVFSSEDYGSVYASLMGARHVMVDKDRSIFPVSGTAVRSSPLDYLDFLEPCVRAYFVRRVVVVGAESTGKTTLARLLAERFQTCWVPEYGREHWERKVAGLTMNDPLPRQRASDCTVRLRLTQIGSR